MNTEIVPAADTALISDTDAARLVEAFLSGRSPTTILAYRKDLETFAAFAGQRSLDDAAGLLLARGHGAANALALSYRTHLIERKLAAATVNRRLAALRSLVKLARTLGLVSWTLEVANVKSEPYRDTRGPGRHGFLLLLDELAERDDAKGKRDLAALRLLYDLALRRSEVVGLDLEDVDLDEGTVLVLGKGRAEKARLTLPAKTRLALRGWLAVRGGEPGALFVNFDRAGKGRRLTASGLYKAVRRLGERAGVRVRPHGLRHSAITEALDLTHGDLRSVQRFSRHRDVRVLETYDDNRRDLAGEVASLVAERVSPPAY